ncbi:eukaryotic translation initiation factor 5B-like [Agrilus planipennis]|uniref:Eukaryotic translation initiation factor 5B-like n=1 Tax=Agrilus planipennis TaxID=224129 RepID=A0A1W4XK66_AGRPL|nr:eukaryotic translation initiation factor 5B-like [Agrilus planipennis]
MIFLITLLSVTSSLLVAQEVGSNEKSKPAVPSPLELDKEPLASIINYYSTSQKPTAFKTSINPRIRSVSSPLVHKSLLKSPATTPPSSQIIGFGPLTSQVSPSFYNSKPFQTKGLSTYGKLSNSVQPSLTKPIVSTNKNKSSKNFDVNSTTPFSLPRSPTTYSFILPIIKYKSTEPSKSKSSYKSDKLKSSSAPKAVLGLPSLKSTLYTGDFGKSSALSPTIKQPSRDSGATKSFKPSYAIVTPIYKGSKDKKVNLTSSESKSNSSKTGGFPIKSASSNGGKKPQAAESAVDSKVFFNIPFIALNVDSIESKGDSKGNYAPYFTTAPLISRSNEASPENQEYIRWAFPRYELPSQSNAPDVSHENENNSKEKVSSEVTGSQFEYSAKHGLPFYGKVLQPKPFEVSILGMPDFGKYVESAIRNAKQNIVHDKDGENVEKNVSEADENQSGDNNNKEEIKTPNQISKTKIPLIKKSPALSKLKEDYKQGSKYYHHDPQDSHEIHHNKKYKWVNGKIVPKCRKLPSSPYPNVVVKNLPHNIAKDRHNSDGSHHHHHYHHHEHHEKQKNPGEKGKESENNSKVIDSAHPLKKSEKNRNKDSTEIIEKIRQDLQGGKKPILEDAEVLFPSDLRPRNKTGQKDKSNESQKADRSNESQNAEKSTSKQNDKSTEDDRKSSKKGYKVIEESREKDNKNAVKEKESSETRKASSEKDRTKEEGESTKEETSKESKVNKGRNDENSSKNAEAKAEEEKRKEEEARREEELRREEEARLEAEAEEREKEIEREILEEFKAVFPDISSLSDFDDDQEYYGRSSRRDRSSSREKDDSREDRESAREDDSEDEDEDTSKVKSDYAEQDVHDDLKHPYTTYMDRDERKKSKKTKFGTPRYGSRSRSKSAKLSQRDSDEELDDDDFFKGWHTE